MQLAHQARRLKSLDDLSSVLDTQCPSDSAQATNQIHDSLFLRRRCKVLHLCTSYTISVLQPSRNHSEIGLPRSESSRTLLKLCATNNHQGALSHTSTNTLACQNVRPYKFVFVQAPGILGSGYMSLNSLRPNQWMEGIFLYGACGLQNFRCNEGLKKAEEEFGRTSKISLPVQGRLYFWSYKPT